MKTPLKSAGSLTIVVTVALDGAVHTFRKAIGHSSALRVSYGNESKATLQEYGPRRHESVLHTFGRS